MGNPWKSPKRKGNKFQGIDAKLDFSPGAHGFLRNFYGIVVTKMMVDVNFVERIPDR